MTAIILEISLSSASQAAIIEGPRRSRAESFSHSGTRHLYVIIVKTFGHESMVATSAALCASHDLFASSSRPNHVRRLRFTSSVGEEDTEAWASQACVTMSVAVGHQKNTISTREPSHSQASKKRHSIKSLVTAAAARSQPNTA